MSRNAKTNLEMIKIVASKLDYLCDKVVFLGGAATSLLVTNPALSEIRSTLDVDVIIEISSREEYYKLEDSLRKLGFKQNIGENIPICRWTIDNILVDIMPTDSEILGFSNKWYPLAIKRSERIKLDNEIEINIVTAPYFIATKIEAFHGRGHNDYFRSHDLEDIITLLDGREELLSEIESELKELRTFLSKELGKFIQDNSFLESISGHLLPDAASQLRATFIKERIMKIVQLGI